MIKVTMFLMENESLINNMNLMLLSFFNVIWTKCDIQRHPEQNMPLFCFFFGSTLVATEAHTLGL